MLQVDRPITKISQDSLGYRVFAKALARALFDQPVKEGLVVAINGAWGSGKTSVVRLALEELKILERGVPTDKRSVTIYFQPWLFAGQHNLVSEFFAALTPQLKKHLGAAVADAAMRVKNATVKNSEEILSSASLLAAVLGDPITGVVAKSGSKLLKAEKKSDIDGLVRSREKLEKLLLKERRRIIVVIDDIDRLKPDEMQLMLGMLKSVADLPGVTYLLPADMAVIRKATRLDDLSDDASYAEKIVQVNLDLPNPSKNGLDELFSRAIREISGDASFDESDLQTAGYYIFNGYIRTPRNINQLANALKISWPALRDEVYFPDLLCVEAIRIFEPNVYKFIRNSRHAVISGSPEKATLEALREKIVSLLKDKGNYEAKSLLRHMLPVFGFGQGSLRKGISNGRRLQDEEGYDLYFRWSYDPNVVTLPEIREFQRILHEDGNAIAFVRSLAARKTTSGVSASNSLLDAISDGTLAPLNTIGAIVSLLANHETIIDPKNDTDFFFTSFRRLDNALSKLLEAIPSESRREVASNILLRQDIDIDAGAAFLNAFIYETTDRWIDEFDTCEIVRQWKETRVDAPNALRKSRTPAGIILKISDVLGQSEAHALVRPLLDDLRFVVKLALDLMGRVHSSAKPKPYRDLTRLPDPDVFDLPKIARMLEQADRLGLPKSDQEDIERFASALKRFLDKGEKPDY